MKSVRFQLRRLGLLGSGVTFGGIALATFFMPEKVAAKYAYAVGTPDAFNEFHAVFTGFWLGLAAMMITAARRPNERLLGDLCGIAIGLQALARLYSIIAHGTPDASFTGAMIGEMVTAIAILQARPG